MAQILNDTKVGNHPEVMEMETVQVDLEELEEAFDDLALELARSRGVEISDVLREEGLITVRYAGRDLQVAPDRDDDGGRLNGKCERLWHPATRASHHHRPPYRRAYDRVVDPAHHVAVVQEEDIGDVP